MGDNQNENEHQTNLENRSNGLFRLLDCIGDDCLSDGDRGKSFCLTCDTNFDCVNCCAAPDLVKPQADC